MRRSLHSTIAILAIGALASLSACSGEEDRPKSSASGGFGGSGNTGNGGAGATAGTSNAGTSSGGTSGGSGGTSSGGTSSAGTGGDAGAGGETVIEPLDEVCSDGKAFRAAGMAFVAPTPPELGLALSSLTYSSESHPISVVARFKGGSDVASVWITQTETSQAGPEIFPTGFSPEPTTAQVRVGGFSTTAPAAEGWLVINDGQDKRIRLINLEVTATTANACSTLTASLTAVIPETEGDATLTLSGGDRSIRSLGGATDGWTVRALFVAESTSFDFDSLP